MPRPQRHDVHLELTYNENKHWIGKIVSRWGNNYRVTRIEWNKDEQGWDVYGELV